MRIVRSLSVSVTFAMCLLALIPSANAGQNDNADLISSPEDTKKVVTTLAQAIREGYVLEDDSTRIAAGLITSLQEGKFDSATTPPELARSLTNELFDLSHDLHLRVSPRGMDPAAGTRARPAHPARASGMPKHYRGWLLDGNVGVLEVALLAPPLEQLDGAMQKLSDADALIIDVRRCPGGSFQAIQSLASAFFDEPELLITHHIRGRDPIEIHTLETAPGGVRFTDKPVYVVTSGFTGSGCEELAFDLKYHDRAVVVGEVTAGAGLGLTRGLTDIGFGLEAFIPNMSPRHPRFEGGFEGTGVMPDIAVPATAALDQAHLMALSEMLDASELPTDRLKLEKAVLEVSKKSVAEMRRRVARERRFREVCGPYEGDKRLLIDDGAPHIEARPGMRNPLEEETHDLYVIVGTPGQKLRLIRDARGAVVAFEISSPDGKDWKRSARISRSIS